MNIQDIETEGRKDARIKELEARLAEAETTAPANAVVKEILSTDKNTKTIEAGGETYIIKRRPHTEWLKYFSKVMKFSVDEDGDTAVEIKDMGIASEFVFGQMLVSPKVSADEVKDFVDVMDITAQGIAFQVSSGN